MSGFFFQSSTPIPHLPSNQSSHPTISAPSATNLSSTTLSSSSAFIPSISYVPCAPLSNTTLNPSLSAARQVSSTQHSLCIPKATTVSTPLALSSLTRPGLDAKVFPAPRSSAP